MSITRVNTNFDAIFATNVLKQTETQLQKAMMRLSTGKRINYASDDPTGVGQLTVAKASLGGSRQAQQNIQETLSMMQFADGVIANFEDKVIELRDIAMKILNDATLSTTQITALEAVYDEEMASLAAGRMAAIEWNGKALFDGSATGMTVQYGGGATDSFSTLDINQLDSATQGSGGGADISSRALADLDSALEAIGTERGELGSAMQRLQYALEEQGTMEVNYASAVSTLGDADLAAEISKLTTSQIISQSAAAMLGQANIHSQTLLNILM